MKLSDRKRWAKQIGENLRRARKGAGLTQGDLAEAARLARISIHRLEHAKGNHLPTLATLSDLADAIPCTLRDLIGERP